MRYLIMGPQGVGKGTQAALVAEHFQIPTISTGDIFRFNIKNNTELGKEAVSYTSKGELVPDELTGRIVASRLAEEDATKGWLLDGYPRNASQVETLDQIMKDLGQKLDAVIFLTADRDVLMERITKRAQLEGREDDTPDAIERRLDIYEKETKPLIDVYRSRGLVLEVPSIGEIPDISAKIIAALEK